MGILTESFQEKGHVMVRDALGGPELDQARQATLDEIERSAEEIPGLHDRPSGDYVSITQVRERCPRLRETVYSPALAALAADALGVDAVRVLYDQLFVKPPGSTFTMWHQDQPYWPIDTSDVLAPDRVGCTRLWLALTALPAEIGGLFFVDGSHRLGPVTGGDNRIRPPGEGDSATIGGTEHSISEYGEFAAGDATLHAGYTLHGSRSNEVDRTRYSLTITYVPDGTRVAEPTNDQLAQAIELCTPGCGPGDVIDGPLNPVLRPIGVG